MSLFFKRIFGYSSSFPFGSERCLLWLYFSRGLSHLYVLPTSHDHAHSSRPVHTGWNPPLCWRPAQGQGTAELFKGLNGIWGACSHCSWTNFLHNDLTLTHWPFQINTWGLSVVFSLDGNWWEKKYFHHLQGIFMHTLFALGTGHWCNALWLPVLRLALTQVSTVRWQHTIRKTVTGKFNPIKSNCPSQHSIPQLHMAQSLQTVQQQQGSLAWRSKHRRAQHHHSAIAAWCACSPQAHSVPQLAGTEADGVTAYMFNSSCSYLQALSGSCQPSS